MYGFWPPFVNARGYSCIYDFYDHTTDSQRIWPSVGTLWTALIQLTAMLIGIANQQVINSKEAHIETFLSHLHYT